MNEPMMTSTRPYLLRAFYEWIVDNALTPYAVVDSRVPYVQVPEQYVDEQGQIILNIGPVAVQGLLISNEAIEFNARFSGVPMRVYAPIIALNAIYAKENGRGIVFAEDDFEDGDLPPDDGGGQKTTKDKAAPKKGRPNLTIVK